MRTLLPLKSASVVLAALMLTSACKKNTQDAPEEETVLQARSAESFAAESLYGEWDVTSDALRDTTDMDPDEAAFVQALTASVKTWVSFRDDGTSTMSAQVGESEPKHQQATWNVVSVTRTDFTVEMLGEGQQAPQTLVFVPQQDGSILMTSGDSSLVLVRRTPANDPASPSEP